MSVRYRLNRLFALDGRCCEVAMDHGVHNEPGFLAGIENLKATVDLVSDAGADALLLSVGQAALLQDKVGRNKPSLILRSDPTNFYGNPTPAEVFCELLPNIVEQAMSFDAVSVVVNLLWAPDQPSLHRQCVRNISKLKPQCERYGLPIIVEALLMHSDRKNGGYEHDCDTARSAALVRQAVELGADAIKTDSLNKPDEYYKIIESATGKPVLLRGGSRVNDKELLSRTHALIHQGAAGIVYGRNIYQHQYPARMLKACNAIVHHNAAVAEAEAILNQAGS